jgi:hypothetical protein
LHVEVFIAEGPRGTQWVEHFCDETGGWRTFPAPLHEAQSGPQYTLFFFESGVHVDSRTACGGTSWGGSLQGWQMYHENRTSTITAPFPPEHREGRARDPWGGQMNDADKILCDRETLVSLRSLIQSMIICLNGFESRFTKEIEMIKAIDAMAEKAVDLIDQSLAQPGEP